MKTWHTLLAAAIAALSLSAQADITIGVTLSATGPAASLGIPEKNTIDLMPRSMAGHKVKTSCSTKPVTPRLRWPMRAA